jgi:predicted Rossmann fold nucleotide-binding protein DprA/Smf involved in DNA uptake
VLAALYLRGAPRPFDVKRAGWHAVERCLRVRAVELGDASHALRSDGLWEEATALDTPGLMDWALSAVCGGRVLTAADDGYPLPWLTRLGRSAPPAVWIRGVIPPVPFLSIVGSRDVGRRVLSFARDCGKEAVRLGYSVVSGGAKGCDRGRYEARSILMAACWRSCPSD